MSNARATAAATTPAVSYTHLNAVYLTRIANLLNRKGRNPTAFFADEVVTTYILSLIHISEQCHYERKVYGVRT